MTSLNRKIANGATWTVTLRFGERLLGLVSTLILARLLAPEHFGLIAMGTVLVATLETLTAFGFETALIHRQTKEPAFLDSAWTLNLMLGAGNGLVLLAAAPIAAWFYGEDRVVEIVMVLALTALLHGMHNIGMVLYEQDIRFARIFVQVLIKKVVSIVVTISAALILHDHRALLVGMVTSALSGMLLSFALSPYRPRLRLTHWRELVGFSKWLLVNNMLHFLGSRGADFIVGRMAGASSLGAFSVSYELANLPTSEMVGPITRAVFPGYAQMAHDLMRLRKAFIAVYGVIAVVALPAAVGIACLAKPFVAVLLGEKWGATVPLIEALALFGATRALQANTGSVYLALGKPYIMTVLAGIYVFSVLAAFGITLAYWDIGHAVWTYFTVGAVMCVINLATAAHQLQLAVLDIVRATVRPMISVTAMVIALLWALPQMPGWLITSSSWTVLLGGMLLGATVYTVTLWSCWKIAGAPPDAEQKLLRLAIELLHLRRTAAESKE